MSMPDMSRLLDDGAAGAGAWPGATNRFARGLPDAIGRATPPEMP